jgi:hypothetical protein
MQIDNLYIKKLLDRILEHNCADFDIGMFSDLWDNDEDLDARHKFVFHFEIFVDQGFVVSSTGSGGIGIRHNGNKADPYVFSIIPLRLTAAGHQFAAALNKPDVFKILKDKFNNDGPFEFVKAAIKLSSKVADRKLSSYLDDE